MKEVSIIDWFFKGGVIVLYVNFCRVLGELCWFGGVLEVIVELRFSGELTYVLR